MISLPNVSIHVDVLVRAPDQPAASKGGDERDTVQQLSGRTRHTKFIHEPVKVQEGGREFIKHKVDTIVITKRPLICMSIKV